MAVAVGADRQLGKIVVRLAKLQDQAGWDCGALARDVLRPLH